MIFPRDSAGQAKYLFWDRLGLQVGMTKPKHLAQVSPLDAVAHRSE